MSWCCHTLEGWCFEHCDGVLVTVPSGLYMETYHSLNFLAFWDRGLHSSPK